MSLNTASVEKALQISNIVKCVYPGVVFVLFVGLFIVYGVVTAPDDGDKVKIHAMRGPGGRPLPIRRKSANQLKAAVAVKDFSPNAKLIFRALQTAVLATFLVNAVSVILQSLIFRGYGWWPGQSTVIYIVASFFGWAMVMISLIDTKPSPTWVHLTVWLLALPVDLIILGANFHIYNGPHKEPIVGDQNGGPERDGPTFWEMLEIIMYLVRNGLLLAMIMVYVLYKISTRNSHKKDSDHESRESLLGENGQANGNGHTYNTIESQKQEQRPHHDAWAKPTETPSLSWYSYIRGFVILLPYLWPRKSIKLQILALVCFLIMITQRVINIFVPILTGIIINALTGDKHDPSKEIKAPWLAIALYIFARWLQGGQGLLSAARTILWIPVEQYSYRAISTAAFEHVHGLSAEFHTGKRTGELISALNKGSAINSFLEMVTFNVGPMILDLIVAVGYLTAKFDIYLGLVVAIVTFLYIYVTIRLAAWRVQLRRDFTNADREMEAVKNDSLHSWDTVKYFNAETYEFNRYRSSIKVMQGFEYWVDVTLAYMNTIQGALFMVALLVACFIEAFQVTQGLQRVGDFVALLTLMMQLQAPLNFFGTFYRAIQSNLINAERMLELFKEQPNVTDKPDAEVLKECNGEIIFDNVHFSYDKRTSALNSLSFRCAPGTTTALVGESGGGKTTIMRLLFRYYNPDQGDILLDGTSVQDLTIDSVRQQIGVVPQDCNMFNESIMYNLKYANQDAKEEQIYDACRAASIHDRILQFTDKYNTKVGERGVKLSGGERQRVAIARTILKDPKITLLDEATAALDTETEERIQQAFKTLAVGRTMLIIAHRLSTIIDADQILVLSGGTVVERGTHAELMELDGKYASMWRKQSRAQKAAAEAEELRSRAKKALEAAEADSANVSEDEVERSVARRSIYGSSKKSVMTHKKVNWSQSSLGKGWTVDSNDKDDEHGTASGNPGGSGVNGGKPPGHP